MPDRGDVSILGRVSIQSQKPRNPRRATPISSGALSENHEIPWDPSRFLPCPPSRILLSSDPFDACWKLFHICTRATSATMGPQNIYFLGPWLVQPSGRSERGLNLVKGDNGSDGTPGFDFGVKRYPTSCPWSKSLPAYRFILAMPRRAFPGAKRRSNFLICFEHAAGCGRWFSKAVRLLSATCTSCGTLNCVCGKCNVLKSLVSPNAGFADSVGLTRANDIIII